MLTCAHKWGAGSVLSIYTKRTVLPRKHPCLTHSAKKLQQRAHSFNGARTDARLLAVEVLFATVALGALLFPKRPRGWTARNLVEVRPSAVAGKGVFACELIIKGTILGAYPGIPRSNAEMLQKVQRCPRAAAYVFATDTGYLDPTDQDGLPLQRLLWVDASMAFVNEPPVGASVNVDIVDGKNENDLLFVSSKDIPAGAELYLDYGRLYDRSSYDPKKGT